MDTLPSTGRAVSRRLPCIDSPYIQSTQSSCLQTPNASFVPTQSTHLCLPSGRLTPGNHTAEKKIQRCFYIRSSILPRFIISVSPVPATSASHAAGLTRLEEQTHTPLPLTLPPSSSSSYSTPGILLVVLTAALCCLGPIAHLQHVSATLTNSRRRLDRPCNATDGNAFGLFSFPHLLTVSLSKYESHTPS